MSREDITAVLLPKSRIDIYALDDATANLIEAFQKDWRFARVDLRLIRNGIETAIEQYEHEASPELVIVETNDISEVFISKLGELAGFCAEGTDAIIIGPDNDVHLYRNLVEMGVKDYLVRPVSEDDMLKVLARSLIEKRGMVDSRLVAVIGSKGGVGTTAVAQALSWNISETLKQKTMLMDLAGSISSLGISYGLEPAAALVESVRIGNEGSDDDIKRICQIVSDNLSILFSGGDPILTEIPDPDSVEGLLNRMMQKYPVVIVDLSGTSPSVQRRVLERASEIVLVTTPNLSSLRNARSLLSEFKSLKSHLEGVDLVINKRGLSPSNEVPAQDIKEILEIEPTAVVPYVPKVFVGSEASGKPVGQDKAAIKILEDLMPIATKATEVDFKKDEKSGKQSAGLMDSIKKALGL